MPMPDGIGVIDLMLELPTDDRGTWYDFMKPLLMDQESRELFKMPAEYMFNAIPTVRESDDYIGIALDEMDKHGIEKAMISVRFGNPLGARAMREHTTRFIPSFAVNPNLGMDGVRELRRAHAEFGVKAATAFPAGCVPQVPINDKKFFPIYAACIDLDIPIFVCAGVPGPRVPMACQDVSLIDEVCWFFPELRFVTRHGCEPWTDLIVKLMLKYPNLYYSTSAFAPQYYPKNIIEYANTRGTDKILYAGYFPAGLTYDRIWGDMPNVGFKDEVWPKFLRENARKVLKL